MGENCGRSEGAGRFEHLFPRDVASECGAGDLISSELCRLDSEVAVDLKSGFISERHFTFFGKVIKSYIMIPERVEVLKTFRHLRCSASWLAG